MNLFGILRKFSNKIMKFLTIATCLTINAQYMRNLDLTYCSLINKTTFLCVVLLIIVLKCLLSRDTGSGRERRWVGGGGGARSGAGP